MVKNTTSTSNGRPVYNPLPEYKILALSKLKAFAKHILNITQNIKLIFHRVENIVGKGEYAGYQT